MNLYLRTLWMFLMAYLAAKNQDVMAESRLTYRCWPWDLDFNLHMTNSRYNSFMDLTRIDHMIRSGAWARLRKAGLYPVLGSLSLRFRRSIAPFQPFHATTKVLGWDERWIYIEHRILTDKDVASIAVVKTIFLKKGERVPTSKIMEIMGYTGPVPEIPPIAIKKEELDRLLAA